MNGTYKYDFSTDSSQFYGGTASSKMLAPNLWGVPAGDINADGIINDEDKTFWNSDAGTNIYTASDINLDGQVENQDMNEFWIQNFSYSCQVPE